MAFMPGLDLQNVKGLRDVIVRAVLQAQNLIHIIALGRQHDNRHIGKLANLLADLKAVQLWKHHIQKYDIILLRSGILQGLLAIVGAVHFHIVLLQAEPESLHN